MSDSMDEVLHPGAHGQEPQFPHAPPGWTPARALAKAQEEGLELGDDHWTAVRGLHEYYARNAEGVNVRELHDALVEIFHHQGGSRYLYALFPGGPVAQGCRIAGLAPPAGAVDLGFGSVQ